MNYEVPTGRGWNIRLEYTIQHLGNSTGGGNPKVKAHGKLVSLWFSKVFAPFWDTEREPQDAPRIFAGRARIRGGGVSSPLGGKFEGGEFEEEGNSKVEAPKTNFPKVL